MQVAAIEGDATLLALAKSARSEPVTLREDGRDLAVVMSVADYRQMCGTSWGEFSRLRNDLAAEAKANGLTEDILQEILAEHKAER